MRCGSGPFGGAAGSAVAVAAAGITCTTGRRYNTPDAATRRTASTSVPGTVTTTSLPSTLTSEPWTPRSSTRAWTIFWVCASTSVDGGEPSGDRASKVTWVRSRGGWSANILLVTNTATTRTTTPMTPATTA